MCTIVKLCNTMVLGSSMLNKVPFSHRFCKVEHIFSIKTDKTQVWCCQALTTAVCVLCKQSINSRHGTAVVKHHATIWQHIKCAKQHREDDYYDDYRICSTYWTSYAAWVLYESDSIMQAETLCASNDSKGEQEVKESFAFHSEAAEQRDSYQTHMLLGLRRT